MNYLMQGAKNKDARDETYLIISSKRTDELIRIMNSTKASALDQEMLKSVYVNLGVLLAAKKRLHAQIYDSSLKSFVSLSDEITAL